MPKPGDFEYVYDELEKYFDRVDSAREKAGHKPSDVEKLLERALGIGDLYRDWWEESGDEYS